MGDWVSPRAGLNAVVTGKSICCPCRESSPGRQFRSETHDTENHFSQRHRVSHPPFMNFRSVGDWRLFQSVIFSLAPSPVKMYELFMFSTYNSLLTRFYSFIFTYIIDFLHVTLWDFPTTFPFFVTEYKTNEHFLVVL
jgi:hypothetical protein